MGIMGPKGGGGGRRGGGGSGKRPAGGRPMGVKHLKMEAFDGYFPHPDLKYEKGTIASVRFGRQRTDKNMMYIDVAVPAGDASYRIDVWTFDGNRRASDMFHYNTGPTKATPLELLKDIARPERTSYWRFGALGWKPWY